MGPPKANLVAPQTGPAKRTTPLGGSTAAAPLGSLPERQSSVKFLLLPPWASPGGVQGEGERGMCLVRSQFGKGTKQEAETTKETWRADTPRSIWRPLMQPRRIEHVLSGTGTVLSTTTGVSGSTG
jgi:hypothetical protein